MPPTPPAQNLLGRLDRTATTRRHPAPQHPHRTHLHHHTALGAAVPHLDHHHRPTRRTTTHPPHTAPEPGAGTEDAATPTHPRTKPNSTAPPRRKPPNNDASNAKPCAPPHPEQQ